MDQTRSRMTLLPRVGDGKISFIPNDTDHDGWLLLGPTGRLLKRAEYPKLFQRYGTYYGAGDGSTTFALPAAGGRFPLYSGGSLKLGDTGGVDKVKLAVDQIPKAAQSKHAHGYLGFSLGTPRKLDVVTAILGGALTSLSVPVINTDPNATTGLAGSDVAAADAQEHTNMPPYFVINLFVFAGLPVKQT